jgi:hypothetical protein
LQSSPVARHSATRSIRHLWPSQLPEQQSLDFAHPSPTLAHRPSAHAPFLHENEQHSALEPHAVPVALQVLVHARLVVPLIGSQRPEQHSARAPHASPPGLQLPGGRQIPLSQRPEQH